MMKMLHNSISDEIKNEKNNALYAAIIFSSCKKQLLKYYYFFYHFFMSIFKIAKKIVQLFRHPLKKIQWQGRCLIWSKNLLLIVLTIAFTSTMASAMIRKPRTSSLAENPLPLPPAPPLPQQESSKTNNFDISWGAKKSWKTLSEQKVLLLEKYGEDSKNINFLSQLALLNLYSEDYTSAFKNFKKLNYLQPVTLHRYYEALSLSIIDPSAANKKWNSYFTVLSNIASDKIWISLGEEVQRILNFRTIPEKEIFRSMILWFYKQRAFYTTYMLLELYKKYTPARDKSKTDIEFIYGTKANILIKLGFLQDAIAMIKKIEDPSDDQKRKLAVAYYYNEEYQRALDLFTEIENPSKKNSTYYYYLSLSHLRLNNFAEYHENASWLQKKQNEKFASGVSRKSEKKQENEIIKARLLFQRLNALYPISS